MNRSSDGRRGKFLIVTGDDFGASPGINRGIVEAHRQGILTSASLIVNMPWSEEAASSSRTLPRLSIGLHVRLTDEQHAPMIGLGDAGRCWSELHAQFRRFRALTGCEPSHLDSHHNVHRDPRLLPCFLDFARQHGLPLRGYSAVRYFTRFYGQWDGVTHLEQISVESLLHTIETEIPDGFTELGCHPGYVDEAWESPYATEREVELATLCSPLVKCALARYGVRLVSFRDARPMLKGRGDVEYRTGGRPD